MARMCSRIVIAVIIILTVTVGIIKAVDISSARYIATIAVQNTGSAATKLIVDVPISGNALSTGGYIASNTLNAAIVEGSTQVPSQPPSLLQSMDGAVHDDGGVLTSYITEINNDVTNDTTLLPTTPAVNDTFYFGADNQFRILTIDITQAGSGIWDFAWEYWTGLTWTVVTTLDDRTLEFTTSGVRTVSFDLPTNWARQTVHVFADKYWLRARVSAFTSVTVQPLAKQAWWETGTWWLFEDALGSSQQITYTLALAATSTLVTNHQFFPGVEGYATPDNALLELGSSNFTLTIEGFLNTDILTGAYVNKLDAFEIFNSASGTIKLELNNLTSTILTNVPVGYHTMTVTRGFASISLAVLDVGSVTLPFTSTVDNSNSWQWGTQGTVSYFNSIRITNPSILATPARTSDNVPTEGIAGQSYNRAMAFGTSTDVVYVWGGGNLGSGSFVTQLWKYTFSTNTWALVAGGALPSPGEQYVHRTYGNYGNKIIATSTTGCNTHVYNIDTNIWTLATVTSCNGFGDVATMAGQYYYFLTSNGTTSVFSRLDIDNPTGAWASLTAPDATIPQFGALVYDPLTNRLVYFNRDSGSVRYYNITANTWTNLGNIFAPGVCPYQPSPPICNPTMAWWDTAQQSVVATSKTPTSNNPMKVWRLVWDSISSAHFDQIGLWTDLQFAYIDASTFGVFPAASIALGVNTRLIFGSGVGGTGVVANRFWQATTQATVNINDLYYAPQELIGETLDDQSLNDIDATVSYPQGLSSQYIVSVSPITSTGVIDSQSQEVLGPTVTDAVPDADLAGSFNPATVPFGDFIQALSDITNGNIPALAIWYTVAGYLIVMVGLITYLSTGSIASSGAVMVFTTLGFTQIDGGLFPQWVFYMFAMVVFAVSLLRKAVFL